MGRALAESEYKIDCNHQLDRWLQNMPHHSVDGWDTAAKAELPRTVDHLKPSPQSRCPHARSPGAEVHPEPFHLLHHATSLGRGPLQP